MITIGHNWSKVVTYLLDLADDDDGGGDEVVSMALPLPPPLSSLLLSSAAPLLPTADPVDLRPRFDFGGNCFVQFLTVQGGPYPCEPGLGKL